MSLSSEQLYETIIIIMLAGLVAGWVAGEAARSYVFVSDLAVGVIGAFIGEGLVPRLGAHLGYGLVSLFLNDRRRDRPARYRQGAGQ
jgi:uncharacterized membrane protein YeaQ/YmgE (transglycosylase-associated protein family)